MRKYRLKGPAALVPIFVFLCFFIGSGLLLTLQNVEFAFYKLSPTVAILPALGIAIFFGRQSFSENISVFLEGVREKNIITMCMIYLLAGAYTGVLKGIGGVESTVQLALHFLPSDLTLPGMFVVSALISTAMGTSMGTIAAVAPIAQGISHSLGIDPALMAGAVVSGAMFGDNLSMISDTTIASTQIHRCSLRDKFKINALIALVPMGLTLICFYFAGNGKTMEPTCIPSTAAFIFSLPHLIVFILAILGINVFVILFLGLGLGGAIGLLFGEAYTGLDLAKNIFEGYASMNEILILSLLIGGLSELAKDQGGIRFLIHATDAFVKKWAKDIRKSRSAEVAVSAIVSFCDMCTANNTIAIILSGEATLEIAKRYYLPPARVAALVNIFACVFQGVLPYSAQILLAGSIAGVSPLLIVPHVYYCYLLGIGAVVAIFFRWPASRRRDQ